MNWNRYLLPAGLTLAFLLLVWLLGPVLMPFLVAAAIAYFCDPLVEKACRGGVPRTLAVALMLLVLLLIAAGFLLLVVPLLQHEAVLIAKRLPGAVQWLETVALPQLLALTGNAGVAVDLESLRALLAEQLPQAGTLAARVIGSVGRSSLALIGLLASVLLIPVILFYLLRDWPQLKQRAHALVPLDWRAPLLSLVQEIDSVLSAFVRGQGMVMISLAIYYALGLSLVGLDVALLVGVFTGLASFIPYLGFGFGMLLGVLSALLQTGDPTMALWVVAVFAGGQVLEGIVLQPLLLGDRIGLHPVAVLFAILAGGELFGFVGVLLALPVAAVILVLLKRARTAYTSSDFFRGDDAPDLILPGEADNEAEPRP